MRNRRNKKIIIPPIRPRGTPPPPATAFPNPKKEAEKRACRKKVKVAEETE